MEEFLRPRRITQTRLAKLLGVSVQSVNELVKGKRGMTPRMAWLLAAALGTSPQFWMHIQTAFDLHKHKPAKLPRALRQEPYEPRR